ncbi:hypothetical protein DL93DRAFT_979227 [Clavulina sp. PMI_390]|nr:hypothetical protein DL93DRAFT_979227 [Clavulina sp. PMI_390]
MLSQTSTLPPPLPPSPNRPLSLSVSVIFVLFVLSCVIYCRLDVHSRPVYTILSGCLID